MKKIYGRKCKNDISAINENMLIYYIHANSHQNCMYDGFIWYPTYWYMYFSFYFLGNKMFHRPSSVLPRPGSLLMLLHFLFTCSIFLLNLPFVLIITNISHQMVMRESVPDMVDVQSLRFRHQMSMLHYWIFYIRFTVHGTLRNSHTAQSIRHAFWSNSW